MELTLGSLLDSSELGLRLLTGDEGVRSRLVRGAHPIEVRSPTRWVPQDWVMLTNGLRLRGKSGEQRRLIAELDRGGQAALEWAIGIVMQRVPQALVDEARRRSFPVFLVPIETAFHQIVSYLGQSRMHHDVYTMQRHAAMHDYLVDALAADWPGQAIVRRLASLLDTQVLLTTSNGEPIESSDALPPPHARAAIQARDPTLAARTTLSAEFFPIPAVDKPEQVLVVSTTSDTSVRPDRTLIHRAVQLLSVLSQRQAKLVEASQQQGAALLRRCLEAPRDTELGLLDAELIKLGIDLRRGAYAVVFRSSVGSSTSSSDARALFRATNLPHLLTTYDDVIIALVCTNQSELVAAVKNQAQQVVVGIGARIETPPEFQRSLIGAEVAILFHDPEQLVVAEAELDPVGRLLTSAARDGELDQFRALLGPLREKPHLLDTLTCWLEAAGDNSRAAAQLHLHRNTLRYRLSQVEHLTRIPLHEPRQMVNLEFALLADKLHTRLPAAVA